MKKTIFIITLLLLLTGCKIEYKIDLNNLLDIKESTEILLTTEEDKIKLDNFDLYIPINKETDDYGAFEIKRDDLEYYNSKKEDETITFNYKFKKEEYDKYINSTFVNLAYDYVSISEVNDSTLVLSTSKEFLLFEKYLDLEEVKVTINTDYKVLSNNADEVNNHDYTWIITKDNAYGKGIYLKIDTTKEDLNFFEKLMRGDYLNIFTLYLAISLTGFLAYKFFKKYSQKRDEI